MMVVGHRDSNLPHRVLSSPSDGIGAAVDARATS